MVNIAGLWEQGWNTPIKEFDLWNFMLKEFHVDQFYMTPVSGIDADIQERALLDEVINENPLLTVIHVDQNGDFDLVDFVHPENALYVFGRSGGSTLSLKKENHLTVKISTLNNQGGFWAHQAAAIILYDRYLKSK